MLIPYQVHVKSKHTGKCWNNCNQSFKKCFKLKMWKRNAKWPIIQSLTQACKQICTHTHRETHTYCDLYRLKHTILMWCTHTHTHICMDTFELWRPHTFTLITHTTIHTSEHSQTLTHARSSTDLCGLSCGSAGRWLGRTCGHTSHRCGAWLWSGSAGGDAGSSPGEMSDGTRGRCRAAHCCVETCAPGDSAHCRTSCCILSTQMAWYLLIEWKKTKWYLWRKQWKKSRTPDEFQYPPFF